MAFNRDKPGFGSGPNRIGQAAVGPKKS